MAKYRGKTGEVEAVQYLGNGFVSEPEDWLFDAFEALKLVAYDKDGTLVIPNPAGDILVEQDDYIIRGDDSAHTLYTMKPDVFEAVYDEVNSSI